MGGGVWWGQAAGYKGWQVVPAGVRHGRHSGSRPSTLLIRPCSGNHLLILLFALGTDGVTKTDEFLEKFQLLYYMHLMGNMII